MRIASRFEPVLFVFILSGLMSLVVSGIATWKAVASVDAWAGLWMGAWLTAWLVAFPVALVVAPAARRAAGWLAGRR